MVLDFRTKAFLALCVSLLSLSTLSFRQGWTTGLVLGAPVVLTFCSGQRGRALKIAVGFILALALRFLPPTLPLAGLQFLLPLMAFLYLMIAPGLFAFLWAVTSTPLSSILASLRAMKGGDLITIPVSVMYRFFYTLREDSALVKEAMKMQGVMLRTYWRRPLSYLEYRVVPLLLCATAAADDVALSAMTRGLVPGRPRTSVTVVRLKAYDWVLMLLALAVTGLCFARGW